MLGSTYPERGAVAVKALTCNRTDNDYKEQKKDILEQAELREKLKNDNVLPFIGIGVDIQDQLYLLSPWMSNGSLKDYLININNKDVSRPPFLLQTASALTYLHENKIIHGEINASNILVSSDEVPRALLSGFGLSRKVDDLTRPGLRAGGGAVRWQAPELWDGNAHKSVKTDTYAFGMTIYEVLTGKVPFDKCKSHHALLDKVQRERPPKEPKKCPHSKESWEYLWEVAERCWQADAGDRPSMKTVHGWLEKQAVDDGDTTRPTPSTAPFVLGEATPGAASSSRNPPTPKTTMVQE
ncbi:hypothetical protein FRB99_000657 [Tulasnella sp. 403]|nr:hypothetical protein FRB99_000657 [Tulasnella sp. 403]